MMIWRSKKTIEPIKVDIHSHLIPGIDDGAGSISDSLDMLRSFKELGYQKIITTPHIHPRYPNSQERIMEGLSRVQEALVKTEMDMEVEVAAEYYVDDTFLEKLKRKEPLLSFGDRYLLVECSFIAKPMFFESAIYEMQSMGYQPVFAHPERYKFLEGNMDWLVELKKTGILFQVTLGSLSGYYGTIPQKLGMKLLKKGLVDFLASDLHRIAQVGHLKAGLELKEVQKMVKEGKLLNRSLL